MGDAGVRWRTRSETHRRAAWAFLVGWAETPSCGSVGFRPTLPDRDSFLAAERTPKMFIAWQKLPVKGRGGGPFLAGDPGYAPPWRGLRCEHHGGGRAEWTPFVAQPERHAGQLRQKLIYALPPIRSCCVEDDFHRAAWWHDVDWAVKLWEELGDGPILDELSRDRAAILAEIREVVRKPSPAGLRDFAAFRAEREAEDRGLGRSQSDLLGRAGPPKPGASPGRPQAEARRLFRRPRPASRRDARPDQGPPPRAGQAASPRPGRRPGQVPRNPGRLRARRGGSRTTGRTVEVVFAGTRH